MRLAGPFCKLESDRARLEVELLTVGSDYSTRPALDAGIKYSSRLFAQRFVF